MITLGEIIECYGALNFSLFHRPDGEGSLAEAATIYFTEPYPNALAYSLQHVMWRQGALKVFPAANE